MVGNMNRFIKVIVFFVSFIAAVIILPGIPPDVSYSVHHVPNSPPFTGAMTANNKLDKAEKILEGNATFPESFAIWGTSMYSGLIGGDIITVPQGKVVAHIGPECKDYKLERHTCSQPLGLRFDSSGQLLAADATIGLVKVNVNNGNTKVLIPSSKNISNKQPLLMNDLDVGDKDVVYLSVTSTKTILAKALVELLSDPSGMFLRFNPHNNKIDVLLDDLHFPNGVQLSVDNSFVLICESMKHRILKYHLTGSSRGKVDVFAEVPGVCDNIRMNRKGNFYVGMVMPTLPDSFNMPQFLGLHPYLRKFILRLLYAVYSAADFINSAVPNVYTARLVNFILSFDLLDGLSEAYGLVIEFDSKGNVVSSLHSSSRSVVGISQATQFYNYLYLASPFNNFVARVDLSEI